MPKLPPPPRRPQSTSGSRCSSTSSTSPSAVTSWAPISASHANPSDDRSQLIPPVRVRPPIPVSMKVPEGAAKPWAKVAASRSINRDPASASAVFAAGSTVAPRHRDKSMRSAPSGEEWPATLWPPPRTPIARPDSAAQRTAAMMSGRSAGRRIDTGRPVAIAL